MKKIENLTAGKLASMSFPYSANPKRLTEKAKRIGKKLMEIYPCLFILIPHISVDLVISL